jgi:hypothetical protein
MAVATERRAHRRTQAAPRRDCRLGFTEEGRLRTHVFFAVRHYGLVMMGMLANESTSEP